ncbi:MAG: MFS transporter [Chloroflexi bacterium]|nr:MFS transporter [Chloroflexota bacterium]
MKSIFGSISKHLGVTFRALRHRNFRLYWFGQLISLQGTWMQMVALGWLVLRLTDSPFLLGLAGMAGSIPVMFLILPAGVISDRISKRKVLLFTQAGMAVLAAVLAVLTLTNTINIYLILILAFLSGILVSLDMPARQSFVIEMVGKDDLMNAISLNSGLFNFARIIAPALAGFVIALWGEGVCFAVNSASFVFMIAGLLMMRSLPEFEPPENNKKIFAEVLEGLEFIKGTPVIKLLLIFVAASAFFVTSSFVLMPVFARDILKVGAHGLGLLMSAQGVGALLAAITIASLDYKVIYRNMLSVSVIMFPISIMLFAFSGNFWFSMILLLGAGWMMMSLLAIVNTTIQMRTPHEMRGRIMGVYGFTFMGFMPLGQLGVGAVAQLAGTRWAVFISSLVCLAISILVYYKHPVLRKDPDAVPLAEEVAGPEEKGTGDA